MKKKLATLALSGVLLCSMGFPARAAGEIPAPTTETGTEEVQALPDSLLYCGTVKEVVTGEDGTIMGLLMESEQSGEYMMRVSGETFWIDGGSMAPSSPEGLAAGEHLHVFHSPISTRSLPPQTAAFAIVRNVTQEAGGAHYHEVEAVEEVDGRLQITTSNGSLYLFADADTPLSAYEGDAPDGLDKIEAGSYIMAWYDVVALSFPGQAYAQHIMVLNRDAQPLTRSAFAVLLHTAQGSPVVNYAMDYSDVDADAPYAEAIRWASSEQLISGYGNGKVGPGDVVNREQMVSILWRLAGSPVLADYPGLTAYSDVGEIARYAQPALAWAHQMGLLLPAEGRLGPKDTVTLADAEAMLAALNEQE